MTIAVNLMDTSFATERFSIDGPSSRRHSLADDELAQCHVEPMNLESNPLGGLPHLPHRLSADSNGSKDKDLVNRSALLKNEIQRRDRVAELIERQEEIPAQHRVKEWSQVMNAIGDSPSPPIRRFSHPQQLEGNRSSDRDSSSDHTEGRRSNCEGMEEFEQGALYQEVLSLQHSNDATDSPFEERRSSPGFYAIEPADPRWWEPHILAGGYTVDEE